MSPELDLSEVKISFQELVGLLSQTPGGLEAPEEVAPGRVRHLEHVLSHLSELTGQNLNRFRFEQGERADVRMDDFRQSLGALISFLHAKYLPDDPYPCGDTAGSVINVNQQTVQQVRMDMVLHFHDRIVTKIGDYAENSPEWAFLKRLKDGLSSVSSLMTFTNLLLTTAEKCGLTVQQIKDICL